MIQVYLFINLPTIPFVIFSRLLQSMYLIGQDKCIFSRCHLNCPTQNVCCLNLGPTHWKILHKSRVSVDTGQIFLFIIPVIWLCAWGWLRFFRRQRDPIVSDPAGNTVKNKNKTHSTSWPVSSSEMSSLSVAEDLGPTQLFSLELA